MRRIRNARPLVQVGPDSECQVWSTASSEVSGKYPRSFIVFQSGAGSEANRFVRISLYFKRKENGLQTRFPVYIFLFFYKYPPKLMTISAGTAIMTGTREFAGAPGGRFCGFTIGEVQRWQIRGSFTDCLGR